MEHFENRALWAELFNSRFPNRTLPQELGPFEAYKDLHRYQFCLNKGIYTAIYTKVPAVNLNPINHLYDSKIIFEGKIFQLIDRRTIIVIGLETGVSYPLKLMREIFFNNGDPGLVPEDVDSFTIADGILITSSTDRRIMQWDIETLKCLRMDNAPQDWAHYVAIPGGRFLSYHDGRTIKVWCARTLECLHTVHDVPFIPIELSSVCFTEDKLIFGLSDWDGSTFGILIADLKEKKWLEPIPGHPGIIKHLLMENNWLFSASSDGHVRIWDISTGLRLRDIDTSRSAGFVNEAVSIAVNEGTLFVGTTHVNETAYDCDLITYDLEQGQRLHSIEPVQHPQEPHQEAVYSQFFIHRKHILEGAGRTIEIRDYQASNSAVFSELAQRLKFLGIVTQQTHILNRFYRMPQGEKNKIYEELFQILSKEEKEKLPVKSAEGQGTLPEGLLTHLEGIFLGYHEPFPSTEKRAEAIENYLAKQ